jgi:hypothetical protein
MGRLNGCRIQQMPFCKPRWFLASHAVNGLVDVCVHSVGRAHPFHRNMQGHIPVLPERPHTIDNPIQAQFVPERFLVRPLVVSCAGPPMGHPCVGLIQRFISCVDHSERVEK